MPWPLPDPTALAGRASADIEAAFAPEPVDPRAPESVLAAICRITAMGLFEEHLFLAALAAELMPDSAVETLERHADIWGVTRLAAVAARGLVAMQGQEGTIIPALTELRTAGGVSVLTDAQVTIGATLAADVAVTAAVVGVAGTLPAATSMTLVNPIGGLTVQGGTVGAAGLTSPEGRDREGDDALRARLLQRIRQPPRGGAAADYEAWAKTVQGVERVSVLPSWAGLGTVGVAFTMTDAAEPDSGEQAAVAAAIAPVRPVTAEVIVLPARRFDVDLTFHLTPDTLAVRAAVEAAADSYFATLAIGEQIAWSRLSEAISSAPAEFAHVIAEAPDDAGDFTLDADQVAVRGTFTWAGEVGA